MALSMYTRLMDKIHMNSIGFTVSHNMANCSLVFDQFYGKSVRLFGLFCRNFSHTFDRFMVNILGKRRLSFSHKLSIYGRVNWKGFSNGK